MIKCLICGHEFKQLNGHLRKHNITPSDYCRIYNVKSTISDESRNNISQSTKSAMINKHRVWTDEQKKELSIKLSKRMKGNIPGNKLDISEVQKRLDDKFNHKFTVIKYTNHTKVTIKCNDCGYVCTKSLYRIYELGCTKCNRKVPRVNTWNKVSPEHFKEQFDKVTNGEYTLLSDYISAEDKITVKHNVCGHIWNVTARQFYSNGSRCPLCAKRISHYENDIVEYIKSFYTGEIQTNVRNVIPPYELDIYIPEKNVAIEFNGTYWHSSLQKDKDYHYKKSSLCEEKGIRLIHIWEYEWNDDRQQPILKNIIRSALGCTENKVYARKCSIKEVPSNQMRKFFNDNNIQGFRPGKFSICLIYDDEIVMAYQMGNAFFGKGKYEWEVIRGATKLNTTVVGGASKIWKYFVDKYKPKSCVYYIDYNYFNGKSILKLSDKFKYATSQPSFKNYWVAEDKVKNRDPGHNKEIRELEKQGLVVPIYNAGTKVYVYL